jgi:hypothetical protein
VTSLRLLSTITSSQHYQQTLPFQHQHTYHPAINLPTISRCLSLLDEKLALLAMALWA